MKKFGWVAAVCAVALVMTFAAQKATSQKAEDERAAEVKHLMKAISESNMKRLVGAVKGEEPDSDEKWERIEASAAILNELGHLLMQNGRCPDATWAEATVKLRAGSAAAVKAAKAKDFAALRLTIPAIGGGCKQCHDAHREEH